MSNRIGFLVTPGTPIEWTGPAVLDLRLHSIHTRTARYQCPLRLRVFDPYLPLAMFRDAAAEGLPKRLRIAIGRSSRPIRAIGFSAEPRPLAQFDQLWEFDFAEEKVNSNLYFTYHDGRAYPLYVPNEMFEGAQYPRRIFLSPELPSE